MKKQVTDIIGKRVKVVCCEARDHGDNPGCICKLIGKVITIEKKFETISGVWVGPPSYHIRGFDKRVRLSEVKLLKRKK